MNHKIIPYNPKLVSLAKALRKNMTLSKVLLWNEIKNHQLGIKFSRQIPIDTYIVDFYNKEFLMAIEIDGESHHHDDATEKDKIRQERLESFGIKFIRFDDIDVKINMNWVLNELVFWVSEITQPTPNPSKEGNKLK